MPNLVESARNRILNGKFLTQDELTQAQYELVTGENVNRKEILGLHDTLFGGNLSKTSRNSIDEGPFTAPDNAPDIIDDENPIDGFDLPVGEPCLG